MRTIYTRLLVLLVVLIFVENAPGQVPDTVSFQGFITDTAGTPVNATEALGFRLYKDGVIVWDDKIGGVDIVNGHFSVALGSGNPIDTIAFNKPMQLEVNYGAGSGPWFSPKTPLYSVPYALGLRNLAVIPSGNADDGPSLVGGHIDNHVPVGIVGATIGGGGRSGVFRNEVNGNYGTVGGGRRNQSQEAYSTIAGGQNNMASGIASSIGGGFSNTAGERSSIGGGDGNDASGRYASIGGGQSNLVEAKYGTISGGGPDDSTQVSATRNAVYDMWGTVGGGGRNRAGTNDADPQTAIFATVGGGDGNKASAHFATVGGGRENSATNQFSSIGGGDHNNALGNSSTVGGGSNNISGESLATVSGGFSNSAIGHSSTIGGGYDNQASATRATVAGGGLNLALTEGSTVGGGQGNEAAGTNSTVPGGNSNKALGTSSFAAGRKARAEHDRSFVWNGAAFPDSLVTTASGQFLIAAPGGVGIGTAEPVSQLHVAESVNGYGYWLTHYVATIDNTSPGGGDQGPDGLAININVSQPTSASNYIGFFAVDTLIAAIDGNGSGGVTYKTSGADYAEYLARAIDGEKMEPGDIVGVTLDGITKSTGEAIRMMVVTDRPAVLGNMQAGGNHDQFEPIAFVGQVPVKVIGPVSFGDFIVPSGRNDGTGIAVPGSELGIEDASRIVGCAWEENQDLGLKEVTVEIGLDRSSALSLALRHEQAEIESLKEAVRRLESLIGPN